jgi:hypothetical protein
MTMLNQNQKDAIEELRTSLRRAANERLMLVADNNHIVFVSYEDLNESGFFDPHLNGNLAENEFIAKCDNVRVDATGLLLSLDGKHNLPAADFESESL